MLLRYQGLYVRLNDLRQKWDLSLGLLGDGRRRLGRLGISAPAKEVLDILEAKRKDVLQLKFLNNSKGVGGITTDGGHLGELYPRP